MSFIDNLVRSNGYKNFMAKLYGWGAAVVIIGALFKINHWPGGEVLLIIGMGQLSNPLTWNSTGRLFILSWPVWKAARV